MAKIVVVFNADITSNYIILPKTGGQDMLGFFRNYMLDIEWHRNLTLTQNHMP